MLPSSLPSSCGGDPGVTSYLTCSFSVPVCVQFESSVTEAALHFVHRTRQHARRGVLACKLYRGISLVSNWDVVQLYTCLSPTQRQKDKHLRRYTREVKAFFFPSMWCCSYSCTSVITFVKRPVLWCDAAPAGGLNNSSQSRKSILVCQQLSEALKRVRIKNSARSFLNWQGRPTNSISGSHTVKYLVILFYIYTNCNSAVCYCY